MLVMSKEATCSGSLIHFGFVEGVATLNTFDTLISSHPLIVRRTLFKRCSFVVISWGWINVGHDFRNPVVCSKVLVLQFVSHPLRPIHESFFWNLVFSESPDRPSCKLPLGGLQYLSLLNLKFSKHYDYILQL